MAATDLFQLQYIANQVCLNVGATDNLTQTKARLWINRCIIRMQEMGEWSWQGAYGLSFNTVANQNTYTIPGVLKILTMYLSSPIQRKMTLLAERQFRRMYPNDSAVGTPYYFRKAGWSKATVDSPIFGLYPIPDAIYTVKYDAILPIPLLVNDTDDIRLLTGMPSNLVDLIIEMATAIGFKEEQDVDSSSQMQECMVRLKAAYGDDHSEIEDRLVMAPMEADDIDRYFDPQLDPRFNE